MENCAHIRKVLLLSLLQMVCISLCYKNYYVNPTKDEQCPNKPCHSLSYYLDHPHLFQSNTTFYFQQGIHTIDKSGSVMIKSVSNLIFRGSKRKLHINDSFQSMAETFVIHCTDRFGFFFADTISVLITSITLSNCGTVHVNEFDTTTLSTTISFFESSNITVADVVIQNSTGFALYIHNGLGNSKILKSKFILNEGDYGGNVYLNYNLTEKRCNLQPIHFNIESSDFIQGASFYHASGITMVLLHSCVDIHVNFNSVYMYDNINIYGDGGNIGITIIEPASTNGNHHIAIRNSHLEKGLANVGGGVSLEVKNKFIDQLGKNITYLPQNSLTILNTSIIRNKAIEKGGGFYGKLQSLQMYNFTFDEILFNKNRIHGELYGRHGNMGFFIWFYFPGPSHVFVIEKCIFQSGVSHRAAGFGLSLWFFDQVYTVPGNDDLNRPYSYVQVLILDCQFINNIAVYSGLEISIYLDNPVEGSVNLPTAKGTIKLQNCTFRNNSGYLGSSAFMSTLDASPFHSSILSEVTFYLDSVLFQYDHKIARYFKNCCSTFRTEFIAVVVIDTVKSVTFSNCEFQNNNATGLLAENSKIYINGNITFSNNSGWNGGALALYQSYILPWNNTNIHFYNNHAKNRGGALFIQQLGVASVHYCFIQLFLLPGVKMNVALYFEDNTAEVAGHVLYGGYIDNCTFLTYIETLEQSSPGEIFTYLLNYTAQTGISIITSDPIGVCFCDNGIPDCKKKILTTNVFPGEAFQVAAVVVGQRDGVVPGVVRASFINVKQPEQHSLQKDQYSQVTNQTCTNLTFSIFSEQQIEQLELYVENPDPAYDRPFDSPLITADLLECPPGFALSGIPARCNCALALLNNGLECNIHRQTIDRPGRVWIGCSLQTIAINESGFKENCGVILHTHCPLNYCKKEIYSNQIYSVH